MKEFPQKIVKLNDCLETSRFFKEKNLKEVYQDLNIPVPDPILLCDGAGGDSAEPAAKRARVEVDNVTGTKVMVLPTGSVRCNVYITDLIEIVKPIIRELVEDSNLLKMWISFLIPKIEDGNNFGVSIQEDTLAEIQSVESEAAAFFDQISRYFISRAKVVSKVAKYPHIADYRRAVQELDEKEFLSLWLVVSEVSSIPYSRSKINLTNIHLLKVRNRYCSLHDIVIKNMEKLKKPRSSNAESLY